MAQFSTLKANTPSGQSKNITSSTLIATGPGVAVGVVLSSHTSGTLKLWDNTSGATTVLFDTMSFDTNERYIPLFGARFYTGLYATTGGTVNLTLVYN